MEYVDWNKRLVSYFFRPENADEDVILCVDKDFFREEIAPELGESAWQDFVRCCIQYCPDRRVDQTICDKAMRECDCDWRISGSPPYLGYICLMVLAWTHDDERHAANYYGRLDSLLKENGQLGTVPYIDSQRFARTKSLWSSLAHWSNKQKAGTLGRFTDAYIGSDKHIGRPLRHALISAADRKRLRRLFADFNLHFATDRPTYREMGHFLDRQAQGRISPNGLAKLETCRDDFIRSACGVYESWGSDETSGSAAQLAHLALSIQVNRLGHNSLRLHLHYKDENFPQNIVRGQLERSSGHHSVNVTFRRYQHGWSGNCSIATDGQEWSPNATFLAGEDTLKIEGVNTLLKLRGISRGVIFFEHSSFGPCRQRLNFQKTLPCFLLVATNNPDAAEFLERNQDCLTSASLTPPIPGWALYRSDGLENLGTFTQAVDTPRLALIGGGKLFAKRNVYHRNALPLVVCSDLFAGSELVLRNEEDGMVLKRISLGAERTLRLAPVDFAQTRQVEVAVVAQGNVLDTIRFRIEPPRLAENISSDWPKSTSSDFFPFTTTIRINGTVPYRGTDTFVMNAGACLSVDVDSAHQDWRLLLDESPITGPLPVQLKSGSLSVGSHCLAAEWQGAVLSRHEFSAVEPPACLIAGPIGITAVSVEPELGCQIYPVPESGAQFSVSGNQNLRIDVFLEGVQWKRQHCLAGEIFKLIVPQPSTSAAELLDIYCYTTPNSGLIDSRRLLLQRPPEPVLAIQGETYQGSEVYRTDRPIRLALVSSSEVDLDLTVIVGGSQCQRTNDGYTLAPDVAGHRLPIQIMWGDCPVVHKGPVRLSVESRPDVTLRLLGGIQNCNGCYYKGRLPVVQVAPLSPNIKRHGAIFIDGKNVSFDDRGLALLGHGLGEGQHKIILVWRQEELCAQTFSVVLPPKCKFKPGRKPDLGGRYYHTTPMPIIKLDTSGMPAELTRQVSIHADLPHGEFPLPVEEGEVSLEASHLADGKATLKAMLGDMPICNWTGEFLDESWRRIGPTPGQFAAAHEFIGWRPCWFLKKKGKDLLAVIDDCCPRSECSQCPHIVSATVERIAEWRESAALEPHIEATRDRDQWKRFVRWREASR